MSDGQHEGGLTGVRMVVALRPSSAATTLSTAAKVALADVWEGSGGVVGEGGQLIQLTMLGGNEVIAHHDCHAFGLQLSQVHHNLVLRGGIREGAEEGTEQEGRGGRGGEGRGGEGRGGRGGRGEGRGGRGGREGRGGEGMRERGGEGGR